MSEKIKMPEMHQTNLDKCVKCSICHTKCPVMKHNLEYLGPEQLGPAYERLLRKEKTGEPIPLDESIEYCSNCKRCEIACPHGVQPAYYNSLAKGRKNISTTRKLRDFILTNYNLWGRIASRMAPLANFVVGLPIAKWGAGLFDVADRDFPKFNKKPKLKVSKEVRDKKAIYFIGCYGNFMGVSLVQPTIDILEAYGYQVEVAGEDCCGVPAISAGLLDKAAKNCKKNVKTFQSYIDQGYKVIVTCPSCGLAFKEEYPQFFGEEARDLAENTFDIFEIIEEEGTHIFQKGIEKSAYYHTPCHLIAQKTGLIQLDVFSEIFTDFSYNDEHCCGISGTYGFKKEKKELAAKIGSPIFEEIKEKNPEYIITDCGTCTLQIEQGTDRKVLHTAEVLASLLIDKK